MSLKLLYPGRETQELVKTLSDDWIISGPIRATIHLSCVWHMLGSKTIVRKGDDYYLGGKTMFGPGNHEDPWVQWAAKSDGNYGWLYFYAMDMVEEYKHRFQKEPYILNRLSALEGVPDALPEGDMDEPLFAQGEKFS